MYALAIHPSNPQHLLAGTGSGVYRTIDGGETWTLLSDLKTDGWVPGVKSIAIDDTDPQKVYAGTSNGLFRSVDGGNTWIGPAASTMQNDFSSIAIDSSNPARIYAATYSAWSEVADGLLVSTDSGATWSVLRDKYTSHVEVVPGAPQIIYTLNATSVGKSVDGGATWTDSTVPGFSTTSTLAVASTDTVYLGTYQGVYKSTDAGATWTSAGYMPGTFTYTIVPDPTDLQVIYAGTYRGGLSKSTNSGANWTQPINGITNVSVLDIAATPQGLYAATYDHRILMKAAGGTSWSSRSAGLPTSEWLVTNTIVPHPSNPQVLFAGAYGIYKSTNSGASWTQSSTGLDTGQGTVSIAIHPDQPSRMYAATGNGAFKSVDGGATWAAVGDGLGSNWVEIIVVDPSNPDVVYAFASGLFKSTNGGATWTKVMNGLPDNEDVEALAIHPTDPQVVYAGTNSSGVYKSTNGAASWSAAGTWSDQAWITTLLIHPANPQVVYAGEGKRVMRSDDGGATWLPVGSGLVSGVSALAVDPTDPQRLYAATSGAGVYTVTDDLPPADTTPPMVTIERPANGQTFTQGENITSVFSCTDPGGSGVASCIGPATIDTAMPGVKTFTVTATDHAGNRSSPTVNYRVEARPVTQLPDNGDGSTTPPAQTPAPVAPGGSSDPIPPPPPPAPKSGPTPLSVALRVAPPTAKLTVHGPRLRVAVTARLPKAAKGRTARIEYRKGKRWIRAAQVKVPANGRIARTVTLTRAKIGGVKVKRIQVRIVLVRTAKARASVGKTRTLRVPAPRKLPVRR